jgi:3-oxoacyl-[acyl-carrier-protein] synthase III
MPAAQATGERPGVLLGPVATWFPDRVAAVGQLPELAELPPQRRDHALALGIDQVRVAPEMSEVDLAERAAREVLRRSGLAARDLDGLILVQGRAPQYLMSSEATRLQERLHADRAFTLGVGELGCVSVSAALTVGSSLLRGHQGWRHVLVAMGVKAVTRTRYRAPMTVLGDGGGAVLLSTSGTGGFELVDHGLRTDGKYADLFRIDYRDTPQRQWTERCADEPTYSFRLAVESRNRFQELNREVLARNDVQPGEQAAVLMQNLAAGAFTFWEDALDLSIHDACRRNLARYGHVGPVDVLANLAEAAPDVPAGGVVMVMNSSPVAAWSTTLLRKTSH